MKPAALLASVAVLSGCGEAQAPKPSPADDNARIQAKAYANCQASRADLLARYHQEFSARRYWPAADVLRGCAHRLDDADMRSKVASAEIAHHMATINDRQQPPRSRAAAMQQLARDHPEAGQRFAAEAQRLIEQANRADQAAEKARRKREGVTIGMTQQQALDSSWGRPNYVNRTTTAAGTREQWVYGDGNYLYFRDGVLVGIQNR